jgi:flavin-dependent dehydrogenase
MTYDALVVGAGPGGATAALLLARAGWSVAVVEKARFPRRKVCGEFISATSLPLLHELGIGNEFLERAGPPVQRVGFFALDTVVTSPMPAPRGGGGTQDRSLWGRALGRDQLDLMLLEAVTRAGAQVWQPWCVTGLRPVDGGHACTIVGPDRSEELRARLVIAAPGSWERNDWVIAPERTHRPSDLLAFKAHFEDGALPDDLMPLLVFPGGYGGMVHGDSGRVTLSCCIRRDELQRCRARSPGLQAGEAVLAHIVASTLGVREALRYARLSGAWLSAGPIRPGIRARYADGIFRVGNVAGEAHPIVAEGISMAMQSAWLLCRRLIGAQDELAAGRALVQVGDRYASEWSSWFAPRLRAAASFAHVTGRPTIGKLLLPVVRRFPGILTLGAQLSGKATPLVTTS